MSDNREHDAAYHAERFAEAAEDAGLELGEAARMVRNAIIVERRRRDGQ